MTSQKKAVEMLLTGDPITAKEALQYGLINQIVDIPPNATNAEDILKQETLKFARRILRSSASVIALGKEAFYKQIEMTEINAYHYGTSVMVKNIKEKEDGKEGLNSFVEKRVPIWKHK